MSKRKQFVSWLKPHAKLATVAGVVVIAGGAAAVSTCTCSVPTFGGGGGGGGGVGNGPWGVANSPTTSTANVWLSVTGDDDTCTRSATPVAPTSQCLTFQKAYEKAQLGDTVGMQDGEYGSETLRDSSGKTGTANVSDVTFTPQHTDAVTVRLLQFGDTAGGFNGADHVTINGVASDEVGSTLTHSCEMAIWTNSYDVHLEFVHTCKFYVQGAVNSSIDNSEIGPCVLTTAPEYCYTSFIDSAGHNDTASSPETSGFVLSNNTIHDYTTEVAEPHYQCMFVLTEAHIVGNRFYHCPLTNIFFQSNASTEDGDTFDGLLIENNWFAQIGTGTFEDNYNGDMAMSMPPASQTGNNITVRYNSFYGTVANWGADHATNSSLVGNVYGDTFDNDVNCAGGSGSVNAYNVFVNGSGHDCSGTGEVVVASAPYVSAVNTSSLDYHLSGAAGSTSADNLVPCGSSPYNLATDYDGQSRPQGANCDAGSDER